VSIISQREQGLYLRKPKFDRDAQFATQWFLIFPTPRPPIPEDTALGIPLLRLCH